MAVSWHELEGSFEWVSFDGGGANQAFLCKATGRIYWHSDNGDDLEELPDDIEDGERYIAIPDKRELELGTPLVFEFVRQFLPDDYGKVRDIFSKRGAYARFKDLLEHRRMLDRWHEFENNATEKALREWCALHSIEIEAEPAK
jgi:hypothetical protein